MNVYVCFHVYVRLRIYAVCRHMCTHAGRGQMIVLGGIPWVAFAFHLRKGLSLGESFVEMPKPAEKQSKDLPVSILLSLR